jgi:acyl-coenzyme A synthetase/AMP-(fatty) acid ligase
MNFGRLFFNHSLVKESFRSVSLNMVNGVNIIFWDSSPLAVQSIIYCVIRKQSFMVMSAQWPTSYSDVFLTLIKRFGAPQNTCLIATSGTSGTPKLCIQPIDHLWAAADRSIARMPHASTAEFIISIAPVSMGGLLTIIRSLRLNRPLHLMSTHWATALLKCQAVALALVPHQLPKFIEILPKNYAGIHSLLLGGDALTSVHKTLISDLSVPISQSYGSTETCGQVIASPFGESLGLPLAPLSDVFIDKKCTGQLLIKGPTMALGYLTSHGIIPLPYDSNGFFISNDIVQFYPSFCVLGRIDFQFQTGAQLIHPEHIEKMIKASGIIEHIIVVPKASDTMGHVPVAFIDDLGKQKELQSFAVAQLPRHLRPSAYYKLPKNFDFSDVLLRKKILESHIFDKL